MKKGFLASGGKKKKGSSPASAPKKSKENTSPAGQDDSSRGPTKEEIKTRFRQLIAQANELRTKIGEIEGDRVEHSLALDAFKNLEDDRKCFRKVSGVLVERNVGQVRPALQENLDKLTQVMGQLEEKCTAKEKEIKQFEKDWNIQVNPSAAAR